MSSHITRFSILAALFTTALLAAPAHADPIVSKTCAVSVEAPAGWKAAAQGDQMMVMGDPKDEAGVLLICAPKEDAKKALAGLDKLVGGAAKDIKLEKPKAFAINGMKGIVVDGTATMDGKPVSISTVIVGPTGNGMLVVSFAGVQTDKLQAHAAELLGILKSLKPVK